MKNTFPKRERLSSKKLIRELFDKGSSFHLYPLRIIWLPHPWEKEGADQVMFSVPKRNFRKATDRNKIKRRLREAYRCNKHLANIENKSRIPYLIVYIYTAKELLDFRKIENKLKASLRRLNLKEENPFESKAQGE